jgi:pimeloyl-ACP methyl ester carboxylesterase
LGETRSHGSNTCDATLLVATEAATPTPAAVVRWGSVASTRVLVLLAICSAAVGCASSVENNPVAPATPSATSVTGAPAIDDRFAVAKDGRELALVCWGHGTPTVLLEAGCCGSDGGIHQFSGTNFVWELAGHTRVCAYDRAGTGGSDPAPDEPRDADDVVGDLNALFAAAHVAGPYLLVGSSFGGMIVTYYAARFPDDVAGVVLLDVPAPSATLSKADAPTIAWDHPKNPEHLDVIPEFEHRFAREPLPFDAPLIVITATGGQSDVKDQSVWLALSPGSTQVELYGSHEIYNDDTKGVISEILKLLKTS